MSVFQYMFKPGINLPIALCAYALNHKLSKELWLLVMLKLASDGTLYRKDDRINEIIQVSGKHKRTINNGIKKLKELGWIWENEKKGILHFPSFVKTMKRLDLIREKRTVKLSIHHLQNYDAKEALFVSALIGLQITNNKRGIKRYDKAERSGGISSIPFIPGAPYFGMGIRSIARKTGYSKSQINLLMQTAEKEGFLMRKKKYLIQRNTHSKELSMFKEFGKENPDRLWPFKGAIYLYLPSEIIPFLEYSSISNFRKRISA